MYKVVRKADASVRQVTPDKTVRNYITKEISPNVSFAVTEATDYYEQETTAYDRIYYVVAGRLVLVISGEEIALEVGDTCFLEKETTYEMKGTFTVITVNQPAFGL